MKKFMFQVHPDYFHNNKAAQSINATNLMHLQELWGAIKAPSVSFSPTAPRSLVFYVKPSKTDLDSNIEKPQKVEVSLVRMVESITDILERLGVDVPDPPSELHSLKRPLIFSASSKEVCDFIESLAERRELVRWREERVKSCDTLKQVSDHATHLSIRSCW